MPKLRPMSYAFERRVLQIAVAVGGLAPVAGGFQGLMAGLQMPGDFTDSHFRYMSGLLLGVGAAFWSTIPDIEHKGQLFRTLTLVVVVGGVARLGAALAVGGGPLVSAALGLELVAAPLLCLWRERIERMDVKPPPGYRGPWQ